MPSMHACPLEGLILSLMGGQRSREPAPSYGQALAMANLREQMHLEIICRYNPWTHDSSVDKGVLGGRWSWNSALYGRALAMAHLVNLLHRGVSSDDM